MTKPCSHSDLPSSFEPVINFNGIPALEYLFPSFQKKIYYTYLPCLQLNDGYVAGQMDPFNQKYFFGELIPPYIDILGRGPHFRPTDQFHLKYQKTAKCYINSQRYGSPLYQRMADYYGPQYDIQYGFSHQGYSLLFPNGTYYYNGFFGHGSLFIDLPRARKFEPSYNCTKGFRLINETRTSYDSNNVTLTVYTDAVFDTLGNGNSRQIFMGEDQLYPGTCEADLICYSAVSLNAVSEGRPCTEGYVCDERTSSSVSLNFLCRAGYVCDYGTTPDRALDAPMGQFHKLCPPGYQCTDGTTWGNAYRTLCPLNFFCPTGTGNTLVGLMSNDAVNRDLVEIDPGINSIHVTYKAKDVVFIASEQGYLCQEGIDTDLQLRYELEWLGEGQDLNNLYLSYLRTQTDGRLPYQNDPIITKRNDGLYYRPKPVNLAAISNQKCARDGKWGVVTDAINRNECNCEVFFNVIIAVYRLWKCTSDGILDDIGLASLQTPYNGGRDYWFSRIPSTGKRCQFDGSLNVTSNVNLTYGAVFTYKLKPSIGSSNHGLLDVRKGIELQYTWTEKYNYTNYADLKTAVEMEYQNEYNDLSKLNPTRFEIDQYIYDLYNAILLIEQYGERLEELISLEPSSSLYGDPIMSPTRFDMCECQYLLKCPNGTISSSGASSLTDCTSIGVEVLRRVSIIPSWYNLTYPPEMNGHLQNLSDYWELGGADDSLKKGKESYPIGTIVLEANDVAVTTIDLSGISFNLTYGIHYQISIYVDCKPCPPRYLCNYLKDPPTCDVYPTQQMQKEMFQNCWKAHSLPSCMTKHGEAVNCGNSSVYAPASFNEPDLYKCNRIGFFCDTQYNPKWVWQSIVDKAGIAESGSVQETSTYVIDQQWQNNLNSLSIPLAEDLYYERFQGCCLCERSFLPYYFQDNSIKDLGQTDNKHGFVQLQILAVERTELTVVLELLNGQYYQDFDKNIPDSSDFFIHSPSRAIYNPSIPSRYTFTTFLVQTDIEDQNLALPLNLPMNELRKPGVAIIDINSPGSTYYEFAYKILIGRISDIYQGDPFYEKRYELHLREVYLQNNNVITAAELANKIPDTRVLSSELYQVADPIGNVQYQDIWWTVTEPSGLGFLGLPYLPFFSNCKGSDSNIVFHKAVETDPSCQLVAYEDTVPVSAYPWAGSTVPNADQCNITTNAEYTALGIGPYNGATFQCVFEETIAILLTKTRWYEAQAAVTLFYFGINPFAPSDYEPKYTVYDLNKTYTAYWGRGPTLASIIGTYEALPVSVSSTSYGSIGVIPRQVNLQVGYYQIDSGNKRLVTAGISYPLSSQCVALTSGGAVQNALLAAGIPQCVLDSTGAVATSDYILQLYYIPLGWLDLLNYFQFTPPIYLFFFFMTGILAVLACAFIWGLNRLLTKLRHPPTFHGYTMFYALAQPSMVGVLLGSMPTLFAVLFFWSWFMSAFDGGSICSADPINAPSSLCLEDVLNWQMTTSTLTDFTELAAGRQQMAIFAVGVYGSYIFAMLVMPEYSDDDRKTDVQRAALKNKTKLSKQAQAAQAAKAALEADEEDAVAQSDSFQPIRWRRATFLFLSAFVQLCLMVQMEFSYSSAFGDNVYVFILIFKILYLLIEVFILSVICPDNLHWAPMSAAISTISGLTTMGAPTFTAFLLSFFVDHFLSIIEFIYWSPFISETMSLWPRWEMMLRRRFRGNKRLTRDEKAKEELEWRKINEQIELESEGIEPVLGSLADYAIDTTGLIISPLTYVCLQLFYYTNQIAPLYAILTNQIIYYILFAVVIIPFTFGADVFNFNTNELVHGWKVFDYLAYQRYRFSVREYRWMLRNPVVDESISEEFQTVDLLCFSSQHYFLMGLLSFSMVQMCMAIESFLRLKYNPFADPTFLLIFVIVFLIGEVMRRVYWRLSDIQIKRLNWRGLWATKQIEGTIDDDVAAKLAIGEGRQADLEQERLELQALNSERFRHRFLERNRPWILQHLVELLTPRSLDLPGPDGRPTIEYVRDVYAELMSMGEGFRKPGERDDISSDEEDELEVARRNWSRDPLTGAALAIARMWLAKARKRRVFSKLVRGIIDQNKKTSCEICGRTPERNNVKLTAHLATDGEPDIGSVDRLISGFELLYGANELEPQLWKAYFRANAEYCTRCSTCEDSMAQERLLQASREPGPSRISRAQDISSDEDEDVVEFEPVVVTRTSPEGRMMSKWLVAARKKIGGVFPRPDARKQMERYAQKLRELKMKKARDMVGKAPIKATDEDEGDAADVTAATKALALRWIRMARDALESKFRMRSETFREDLDTLLSMMPEEDDWFFGAAMRLEGRDLLRRGADLEDDRRTLEAEAAVKIHKIENDLEVHIVDRTEELERERRLFITKLAQQNDRINLDIELRRSELEKLKETRKKEFMLEERKAREEFGAAPTEMIQDHRNQLIAIDELMSSEQTNTEKYRIEEEKQARIMFDRAELIKRSEMERRKAVAGENIARIRLEVAIKVKVAETEWQGLASKWLSIARRKVQVKKKEDEDAKAGKRKRKGGK